MGRRALVVGLVLLGGGLIASANTAQGPAAARAEGTSAGAAPPFRFIYDSESAAPTVIADGWNLVDTGSKWSADHLPGRTKGLVWIGDYDNGSCSWEVSDADVKAQVSAAAHDPNWRNAHTLTINVSCQPHGSRRRAADVGVMRAIGDEVKRTG